MPSTPASHRLNSFRSALRVVAGTLFVASGVNHFANAEGYRQIVPPSFPASRWLVAISGVAEIVGGIALFVRPLRRAAAWGLIALLIAVFPANVYMATSSDRIPGKHVAPALLWARLPFQAVFIAWVWFVGLTPRTNSVRVPDGKLSSEPNE